MNTIRERVQQWLWQRGESTRVQRMLATVGRYLYVLGRDLLEGQITLRAMSLVYTTLLSLVPILALAFSLFKGLGIHNSLEPLLVRFLEPLGPEAGELSANIIGFVENIKVGVLGSLGIGLLFYTAVSMIQKVESSFNFIWRIERRRPISQRVGEYLAVLIVGPVLVFSSLGITATVLNSGVVARLSAYEPLGTTVLLLGKLVPYALIVMAFTFVYAFIPNTKVKFSAALAGGALAGIGWQSAGLLFASFVAASASYSAVYSGFAIVILLLIWFYIGWLILLTGCQLAYYVQHPEQVLSTRRTPMLSGRGAEHLGLAVLALTGRRFQTAQPALTEEVLCRTLRANPDHLSRVIDVLLHHGLLAETGGDRSALLPGRDFDSIRLGEVWQLIRRGTDPSGSAQDETGRLLDGIESRFLAEQGAQTLRQWLADQ